MAAEHEREAHRAAVDGDILDHAQRDEVTVQIGVVHRAKSGENGFGRDHVALDLMQEWTKDAETAIGGQLVTGARDAVPTTHARG